MAQKRDAKRPQQWAGLSWAAAAASAHVANMEPAASILLPIPAYESALLEACGSSPIDRAGIAVKWVAAFVQAYPRPQFPCAMQSALADAVDALSPFPDAYGGTAMDWSP